MPVTPKPEAAPGALSKYGNQTDRKLISLPCMEGSGGTLNNLGRARERPRGTTAPGATISVANYTTGAAESGTWVTGSEGARLQLGATQRLDLWTNGSATDWRLKRFTLELGFTSTVTADGLLHGFWQSSNTNSTGRIQVIRATGGTVVARVRSGSSNLDASWSGVDLTLPVHILVTGDGKGAQAFCNGVEGTYSGGFESYTGGLVIHAGQTMRVNWGTNAGLMTLDYVGLTPNRYTQREIEKAIADKYIDLRPDPVDFPTVAFKVGRVKSTQYAVRAVTSRSLASTARIRLVQGATALALAAASTAGAAADTWAESRPWTGNWLYSTGNTAGTELQFRLEERGSDGVYRPRAGGHQRVRLERSQAPRILAGMEDHVGDRTGSSGTVITPAFGRDITLTTADDPTENSATLRKLKAAHDFNYTIESRYHNAFDFAVHIGDGYWTDNLYSGFGTSAYNDDMYDAAVAWQNVNFRVIQCAGMWCEVPGNHDGQAALYLIENGVDAHHKQASTIWKLFTSNPTADCYGIGESGTRAERLPATMTAAVTRFSPGMSIASGQRITTAADDLRAYAAANSGTAGATFTPDPALGAVSSTGDVNLQCVWRWDDVTLAALADDGYPTQTWFAFDWGEHSFFIADSESYSLIGLQDVDVADNPGQYRLGTTQKAAIVAWAEAARAAGRKLNLCIHRLPGGLNYRATTTGFYGRSRGCKARDAATYEALGVAIPPDQLWLSNAAQTFGFVIWKGHDHHFSICVDAAGVVYITCPTVSASSHSEPSFGSGVPGRGWRGPLPTADYGTMESGGLLDPNGDPIDGAIKTINVMGFLDIQCDDDHHGRVKLVRSSLCTKERGSYGRFSRVRKDVDQFGSGPFTASGDTIDLTDALNPQPWPMQVAMVLEESDHADAILPGTVTEAAAETQADLTDNLNVFYPDEWPEWGPSNTYAVGDVVLPDVYTGLLAYAVAITTGVSGGSTPAWEDNVGDSVTDGGVTWKMIPPMDDFRSDISAVVPLVAGSTGDYYADYAPAVVYESADLDSLMPSASGSPGSYVAVDYDTLSADLTLEVPPLRRLRVDRLRLSGTGTATIRQGETLLLTATVSGRALQLDELLLRGAAGHNLTLETSADTLAARADYVEEGVT